MSFSELSEKVEVHRVGLYPPLARIRLNTIGFVRIEESRRSPEPPIFRSRKQSSEVTVLYLSGWRAGPYYGWAPWLRAQLESRGIPMVACSLPHSLIPITHAGVSRLHRASQNVEGSRLLVGHSFGAKVALKALSKPGFKVAGAIFVAPLYRWPMGMWFKFWRNYIDFKQLRENCPIIRVIHSQDDNLVPFQNGSELVRLCQEHGIEAELLAVDKRGHFDPINGCRELPEVIDWIDAWQS